MSDKFVISSSPHFKANTNTTKIMGFVLLALYPQLWAGIKFFGYRAWLVTVVSIVSCVLFEYLFLKLTKQKNVISNLSACVTGAMLAMVCPPTIPLWMVVLGAAVAIIVAKGLFGGIGSNVFNPALTGRAVLFISFPSVMGATWLTPKTISAVDAISSATVLSQIKADTFVVNSQSLLDLFIGNKAGCIGETSILLILISFIFLLVTKIIDWRAPLAMICTVFVCTFVAGAISSSSLQVGLEKGLLSLLTGGVMFGATFMVTDYATTPVTKPGRLIFGFGCGFITFLIRQFGGYPEGVMFSILIMNSIAPFLNNLTVRMYGYGRKK